MQLLYCAVLKFLNESVFDRKGEYYANRGQRHNEAQCFLNY